MQDQPIAFRAYSTAKGFCQSAFAMMSSEGRFRLPNDTTLVLGFHHLIGFAVEVYLKAFLFHLGFEEAVLRKNPYGHDLKALLKECQDHSLTNSEAVSLCHYLEKHKTFEYRYVRNDASYRIIPIHIVFELLRELDTCIDQAIGCSVSFGKDPDEGWEFPVEIGGWRLPD